MAIKLPLKSDQQGIYIFDADGNMFIEIRGWGYLQKAGESNAINEQKLRQDFILNACNKLR